MYPLTAVLMNMLLAIICAATSYCKKEMFERRREAWLRNFIKLENKTQKGIGEMPIILVREFVELLGIFYCSKG